MTKPNIEAFKHYLLDLQTNISQALESIDGQSKFIKDQWQRPHGGHGQSNVIADGAVIEKAGVNFSHVWGDQLPSAASAKRPELAGCSFQALGVSIIIHPKNPYAPTTHFNIRLFAAEKEQQSIWWFGGGFDLTPYYGFVEDCEHWHRIAKNTCEPFGENLYPQFKKQADDYFYLKHRDEHRGIGGILFDDLSLADYKTTENFACNVGDNFLPAYLPILERRCNMDYSERERNFQNYRRGRYVEFNLLYDRGTLFGLQFGGRIESILVSMPPVVNWHYGWQPQIESEEEKLTQYFLKPQDWV